MTRKTHHNGKTGHSYIKEARLGVSGSGLAHVYSGNGYTVLCLSEAGDLVVDILGEEPVFLRISARNQRKMRELLDAQNAMQDKTNVKNGILF